MSRTCGGCQLCCKLLPMKANSSAFVEQTINDIKLLAATGNSEGQQMLAALGDANTTTMTPDYDKPAGQRCKFQKHGVGCSIYWQRPLGCRVWSCQWLVGAELPRPDRCHYVVDPMSASVGVGEHQVMAVQVWVDPSYPDAHHCSQLRTLLSRAAQQHQALALIRYDEVKGFLLVAPEWSGQPDWIEKSINRMEELDV